MPFRTKAQLAHAMLLRAFEAGLRPSWVTGDEVYGRDGELRRFLEQRHQRYVLAVASNTSAWRGFMQVKAGRVLSELKPEDWMSFMREPSVGKAAERRCGPLRRE